MTQTEGARERGSEGARENEAKLAAANQKMPKKEKVILPQCFSRVSEHEKKAYCAKKRIGAYISVAEKTAFFEKNRYCNFERKKTDETECRFKTCRRST